MRVLLAGATGQLGWELLRIIPEEMQVTACGRAELDIQDATQVETVVTDVRPDIIINAAAYTAVDRSEDEREQAYAVNARGAENLAIAARSVGSRLVHISTDFIFDGRKSEPYLENDRPNPLGEYGASKLLGEQRVLAILADKTAVIRTAWVYSAHGRNFVKTMLGLMAERDSVRVVADQVGTPTWAGSLAQAVWRIAGLDLVGIFHWTDAGVASWYDLAVAVQEEALRLGLLVRAVPIIPIRTDSYPTKARRPPYSVLDKTSTCTAMQLCPLHWRVNLRKMLQDVKDQRGG